MSKHREFRELVLFLFDGYPQAKIKESELKELFKKEEEINSLITHGFLVEEIASKGGLKEKQYMLGPHTTKIVLAWKAEELATKIQRLTILVLLFGMGFLLLLSANLVMQLFQFLLK